MNRPFLLFLLWTGAVLGRVRNRAGARRERFLSSLTEDGNGNVDILIGLKESHTYDDLPSSVELKHLGGEKEGRRVNAAKATLTKQEIEQLLHRDDIDYIEEDYDVYMDVSQETIPYGIILTQGYDTGTRNYPSYADMTTGACNDPLSLKVAIIDSGVDVHHPDLPCRNISDDNTNCIGMEFGVDNETWSAPENPHGTHVFGTIAALRNNDVGIAGMVSEPNVCYLFAMIFGSEGGSKTSALIEAVEWALDLGATVINMSLGSPISSKTAETFFDQVRNEGVLLVSAAGNAGSTDLHYPASYSSVISVASVDANLQRSVFSQYNEYVDIAAPGSTILSTVPMPMTNAVTVYGSSNLTYDGAIMVGSSSPHGVEGHLVFCDNYGQETCDGPGGHVCLIERGATSFENKAISCETSGGIAAIIYNTVPNTVLFGVLTYNTSQVSIPVIGVSAEGAVEMYNETYISFQTRTGYAYMDGTSSSTPFVTGAVVELWRHCPVCSSFDIETCLLTTVLPLENNEFNYGLLQVRSAFSCLVSNGCCSDD